MTHNDDETKILPRVPQDDDTIVMSPLVAQVLEASVRQTQGVTNALIDGLTHQEAKTRATLELVREAIMEIANRPYVASPFLYTEALHPRWDDIQERMLRNGYTKG